MGAETEWLEALLEALPDLPQASKPKPHWSQRQPSHSTAPVEPDLDSLARRIQRQISEFGGMHWFAQQLGYECVDGNGDTGVTINDVLDERLGKGHLATPWRPSEWSLDDVCDIIEIHHDLAARPTGSWFHDYMGCGTHPTKFSVRSGQAVYRWKMNEILDASGFGLRVADDGDDEGRIVVSSPTGLEQLMAQALVENADDDVVHAIAMFRARNATRESRRTAVFSLARVLESHRRLLQDALLSKDEGALFDIANNYDIRHRKLDQKTDYDDAFLDWVFYWYLATINLCFELVRRKEDRT